MYTEPQKRFRARDEHEVLESIRHCGEHFGAEVRRVFLADGDALVLPTRRLLDILAGIRTSVIVNVGPATIGATIGAGGLGAPIISGLVNQNPAFLAEGTIIVGLLALTIDAGFAALERTFRQKGDDYQ
jgi:ABC-type proline/glycine betaine transport system permease subunit